MESSVNTAFGGGETPFREICGEMLRAWGGTG